MEKYNALNGAHARYKRIAEAASLDPAFYGEQLSPMRSGVQLGEGIMLASVEARRLLKIVEEAKRLK